MRYFLDWMANNPFLVILLMGFFIVILSITLSFIAGVISPSKTTDIKDEFIEDDED